MATGNVSRGIMFQLLTEVGPGADKAFAAMKSEVDALQKSMSGLKLGISTTGATARASASGRPIVGFAGAASDEPDKAALRRRSEARRAADERDRIAAERSAAKTEAINQRTIDRQIADLKRAEKERAAAIKGVDRAAEHADLKMQFAQQHLRQGFMQATTAVTGLARGFVELGLVGEEDLDKVKDGLLKVYAATDLIRGGVELWDVATRGARVYREALLATAAAEKAVAVARAAGGVASVAGGAGVGLAGRLAGSGAGTAGTAGAAYLAGRGFGQLGGALSRVGPGIGFTGAAALAYGGYRGIQQSRQYGSAYEGFTRTGGIETDPITGRRLNNDTSASHGRMANSIVHGGIFRYGALGIASRLIHGDSRTYKTDEELDAAHQKRVEALERDRARRAEQQESRRAGWEKDDAERREAYDKLSGGLEFGRQLKAASRPLADVSGNDVQRYASERKTELDEMRAQQRDLKLLMDEKAKALPQIRRDAAAGPNGEAADEMAVERRKQAEREFLDMKRQGQLQSAQILREEQVTIRQTQQIAIAGLEKQLGLQKQKAAEARGEFEGALQAKQSFEERLGGMNPSQVRALLAAKRTAESGQQLRQHEIDTLQQGDARSQELARQALRARARQLDPGHELGELEEMRVQGRMRAAQREANRRDELGGGIRGARKGAGFSEPEDEKTDPERQRDLSEAARGAKPPAPGSPADYKQQLRAARRRDELLDQSRDSLDANGGEGRRKLREDYSRGAEPGGKDVSVNVKSENSIQVRGEITANISEAVGELVNLFVPALQSMEERIVAATKQQIDTQVANSVRRQNQQGRSLV